MAMPNSIVRLDWRKGKFDGVYIHSQQNDETDWTRLNFDMRSPYEDIRPPINLKKEASTAPFYGQSAVGTWLDGIVVITLP